MLAAEMLENRRPLWICSWVLGRWCRMIGLTTAGMSARTNDQVTIAVVEDPFEIRPERLNEEHFLRMHHDFTHAYG